MLQLQPISISVTAVALTERPQTRNIPVLSKTEQGSQNTGRKWAGIEEAAVQGVGI